MVKLRFPSPLLQLLPRLLQRRLRPPQLLPNLCQLLLPVHVLLYPFQCLLLNRGQLPGHLLPFLLRG